VLASQPLERLGGLGIATQNELAHCIGIEPGGLGLMEEGLQRAREAQRVLEVGEVARVVEQLEAAPRPSGDALFAQFAQIPQGRRSGGGGPWRPAQGAELAPSRSVVLSVAQTRPILVCGGLTRQYQTMTKRSRILGFGTAAVLVVVGAVGAVVFPGTVGQVIAMLLIGLGLVMATSLVFLEVGLSEDRERAREERQRAARPKEQGRSLREPRRKPRLERMRGRPRKLR